MWAKHHVLGEYFLLFIIYLLSCNARCVPLTNSTLCPTFENEAFYQDLEEYPFLTKAYDVLEFDTALGDFVRQRFPLLKFQDQLGCQGVNESESYYARYTTTVLCASIVQMSKRSCPPSGLGPDTVCAETCAEYARSEAAIANSSACGLDLDDKLLGQIRTDYSLCTTPNNAYGVSCIEGLLNEPNRCGFGDNTEQLCAFCALGSLNSTDTCCSTIGNNTCIGIPQRTIPSVVILSEPRKNRGSAISQGAVIAIVLCSTAALMMLMAIVAMFYWKRRRLASLRNRLATLNSTSNPGPLQHSRPMSSLISKEPGPPAVTATRTLMAYGEQQRDSVRSSTSPTIGSSANQPLAQRTVMDSDDEGYAHASEAHNSRQDFYSQSIAVSRSEASLSSSRQSRRLSFTDQYSGQQINVGSVVKCVRAYEPALPDEISCKQGDLIRVTKTYDDRWCRGVVINADSPDSPGSAGAFPIVCVCSKDHITSAKTPQKTSASNGEDIAETIANRQPPISSSIGLVSASTSSPYAGDGSHPSEGDLQAPLLPVPEETRSDRPQVRPDLTTRPSFGRFREHMDDRGQ